MSLLLIRNDKNYAPWLKALKTNNPNLEVFTPEESFAKDKIEMILTWKAPHGAFKGYPSLKVVGSLGAGVDHLFEDPSLPENIFMTRIVDKHLISDMQEFVLGLCLSAIKNFDVFAHNKQGHTWERPAYRRVPEVTVGIMGLGVLGSAVAETLSKAGFQVCGWSRTKKEWDNIASFSGDTQLNTFLSKAEILVCLLPLTESTKGVLNKELFDLLPNQSYIINVARGGHLNEQDLITALDSGKLKGAALDVFHIEPLPQDHPFWDHPDVMITPHVASMSNAASIAGQVVENYKRMENGEELLNQVSRKKGY